MKKALALIAALFVLGGFSFAREGNVGLGLIFGEPSGLSFKLWTGENVAFDAGAAWSFVEGGAFQVHGDLLFHNFNIFNVEQGRMALYYGFGGRLKLADQTKVSLRVPLGIAYEFEETNIELFAEVVPMLNLAPKTEGDIAGGIGFRYYF